MKRGLKILGIITVFAGLSLMDRGIFASCSDVGLYEVIQCDNRTWFNPPLPGGGAVNSIQWWQLGFGNANQNHDASLANTGGTGTGFVTGTTPSAFIGNDSGFEQIDILISPPLAGAPTGSFCFSSAANWVAPGMDGCADNARTGLPINGSYPALAGPKNDNRLNPYFGGYYGNGTLLRDYLIDAPMAVLARESTGTQFALAFFASTPRPTLNADTKLGDFQMDFINNGDANPGNGALNIIPWQPVPKPSITLTFVTPGDTTSDRILAMSWTPIRLVHDSSTRLSPDTTLNATGVGVLDQGALARYQVERTTMDAGGNCLATWSASGPAVAHPGASTSVTVPQNTCVRLSTLFGRTPTTTTVTAPNAAQARLGDLGYSVSSPTIRIGGNNPLVSQNAVLKVVEKNKNMILIEWDTNSEINVSNFDIVGIDAKGGRKVIGTASCSQCTSGLGASYTELIPSGKVQGSKKVQIVVQPSGAQSNTLDLK